MTPAMPRVTPTALHERSCYSLRAGTGTSCSPVNVNRAVYAFLNLLHTYLLIAHDIPLSSKAPHPQIRMKDY